MRVLAFVYGGLALILAVASGLAIGLVAVLPFAVIPRGRRERFARPGAQAWAWLVSRVFLLARPTVTGAAPVAGLYVCNHRSWLDPLLLLAHTGAGGLSKREIYWIPAVGVFGHLAGSVFFDRKDPGARARARQDVVRLLRGGASVQLYPEGTRTRDGRLADKVHLALVRDAWEDGLPVVPCAVFGSERTLPTTLLGAVPGQRCRLHVGEALRPADFADADAFAAAAWAAVVTSVGRLAEEGR
jgi:1-acyl-sn-glycerol-3-phosphate acyltransferase